MTGTFIISLARHTFTKIRISIGTAWFFDYLFRLLLLLIVFLVLFYRKFRRKASRFFCTMNGFFALVLICFAVARGQLLCLDRLF